MQCVYVCVYVCVCFCTHDNGVSLCLCAQESGKQVVALQEESNLVDKAWSAGRPAAPSAKLRVHPMQVCGVCELCVVCMRVCGCGCMWV